MTVTANSRRRGPYIGNGVTTVFNGPMAFDRQHVKAFLIDGSSMNPVPSSAYTVSRLGNEKGTTVTMVTPPALNQQLLLLRIMPFSQEVDVTNQGAFHAETIEKGFDALEMQLQQVNDDSLQLVFDPDTGMFVWDAKGNRLINVGDARQLMDAMNQRSTLTLIEQVQGGGGTVGITPLFYSWIGDGESTDFPMLGADVDNPYFYDTAMETAADLGDYFVVRPDTGFKVLPSVSGASMVMRFPVPPADGVHLFTTLRGYARPWIGDPPIYTTALDIVSATTNITVDSGSHNTLILVNSPTPVTVTIRVNTGADVDWADGQFFSVMQMGAGAATLAIQGSIGQMIPSPGFLPTTRGVGSIITATCIAPDAPAWAASGDLVRQTAAPDIQCIAMMDRSVLIGTNIATGTAKDSFFMPYGIVLNSIVDGGCYATLAVAQAAGAVVTVNVKVNGNSIFTTKLTFNNNQRTTRTAAAPAVYAAGAEIIPAGSEITIDVDAVGTALAKGLRVYLVGQRA